MSKLTDLRVVDAVLTQIAWGYKNAQLVADAIFPAVTVTKEGGKIPKFDTEAFKIPGTERAPRADSNRMQPGDRTTIDFTLTEHDLEYPMDYREIAEDVFPHEKRATKIVQEKIMLRHEKACADLAQTLGNYPTGNKVTLSGSTQFTHADSTPIVTIETAKEAVRAKIGIRPNVMVLGAPSFNALKQHSKLIERIKYSQKGIVTVDLMKELFGMDEIVIGEAVYATAAGTITNIWGDTVVLAYVPSAAKGGNGSFEEPAFGYTLRKKGFPQVDTRDAMGGKLRLVRNTDLLVCKIVGSSAGYLIYDTCA
jgi:hypothetical protein